MTDLRSVRLAGRAGHAAVYMPETEPHAATQSFVGKLPGEPLTWRRFVHEQAPRGAFVNLADLLDPPEQAVGYATVWVKVDRPGLYYGQCYELCGARHAYMPVAIEAVPRPQFEAWLLSKGGTMDAMQMYKNFSGREAQVTPLLERRGLTD